MNLRISETFQSQKTFFDSNSTKSIVFRKKQLRKLLHVLQQNEELMNEAIYKDLRKSEFEFLETELGLIYSELKYTIDHLKQWASKKRVPTNLVNFPASSYIIPEPLGTIFIIGAWNYPFLLSIHPLISAIASGNTAIVKPSEIAPHSSKVIADLINSNFESNYIYVQEGGVSESTKLLQLQFDKIFFTGSTAVGKIIYEAAAKNLVPVTLELGGKSPCFVFDDAPIDVTAQRIVWGKFINAGQTCVAPDYLVIDQKIKTKLIAAIQKHIQKIYGDSPVSSPLLSKIINENHFQRLSQLLDQDKIIFGGELDSDKHLISPTVMDQIEFDHPIMEEEIFGPILPIIAFDRIEDVISKIKKRPKPLSLYAFTNSNKNKNRLLEELSFGGGIFNETLVHLANHHLPFGGVGASGMGNYHGKFGFDNFSHFKSIIDKPAWFEPSFKYPPFSKWKFNILKKLF
ncbi:aldehyde dehydrogenase [bacterium SCSIO 12643]|nr:aldehyde dehydrogenase [bacterium SCSIO 12643]